MPSYPNSVPSLKTNFVATNTTKVEGHTSGGHNTPNGELNAVMTELGVTPKAAALEARASSATAVVNLLGQLKQGIKDILGTTNWYDAAAATVATIWGKFHATTGHKHTGATNDSPLLDFNSMDLTAVNFNSMYYQSIINGNFDIWQRAVTSTNPAAGAFVADRWRHDRTNTGTLPTNTIHSRQQLTVGDIAGAFYFYRINPDGAGSGFGTSDFYFIEQRIEHGNRVLAGKTVTVSFYARSSISNKKLGVAGAQVYGTGGSPSSQQNLTGSAITLTSSWVKYTQTLTLNSIAGKTFGTNNDDYLALYFFEMWGATTGTNFGLGSAETFVGSGNIDIAQVQVCVGSVALPFQPKTFRDELIACQRYFEKSYDPNVVPATSTNNGETIFVARASDASNKESVYFKVTKRVAPTITLYGEDGTTGVVQAVGVGAKVAASSYTVGNSMFVATPTSNLTSGTGYVFHWAADSEI